MKALEFICAGEELRLYADAAAFWIKRRTLIISDPHFGKASTFRHIGVAVPENVTAHDLGRLDALLDLTKAERLLILGDFLHARTGRSPATMEALESWCGRHQSLATQLITGNHDRLAGSPPECWNMEALGQELRDGPCLFCHEPQTVEGAYALCGHLHPSINLNREFGSNLRLPCFHFGVSTGVFPAFGSFTGTHPIKPKAGERVFALRDGDLMEVPPRLFTYSISSKS